MPIPDRHTYLNQDDLVPPQHTSKPKKLNKSVALAILCFASFVSFFDFTIFVFSGEVLSDVFFPKQDNDLVNKLQVITLFATGFIARPVGAWLIGRYGDRHGRLVALRICMTLFLITAVIGAVLPTYDQIGVLAPVLLMVVRLLQGAAFAGQIILGFVYLAESFSKHNLGLLIGIQCSTYFLGSVICSALFQILETYLSASQLLAYGWRLMFIASASMSLLGFLFLRQIKETPLFIQSKAHTFDHELSNKDELSSLHKRANTKILTKTHKSNFSKFNRFNAILLTIFLALIISSLILNISLLLPTYLTSYFAIDSAVLKTANLAGLFGLMLGVIFYGWLADKLRESQALMLGAMVQGLTVFMFYTYVANSDMAWFIPFYGLLGFTTGFITLCFFICIRLFPIYERLTMTGLLFNITTVFSGVILPFTIVYMTSIFSFAPAMYFIFICVCAFLIGLHIYQSPDIYKLEPLPKDLE